MLEFREISIEDKVIFDRYFAQSKPQASEYNFTNIFMWSNYYGFTFTEIDNWLCILGKPEISEPFLFAPIGVGNIESFNRVVEFLKEYFMSINACVKFIRVSENEKLMFKSLGNNSIEILQDPNNSDYIYNSEDLIKLSGKRYDGKRNHIHKFKREYDFSYKKIDSSNLHQCHEVMEKWFSGRDGEQENSYYFEMLANEKLLKNYEKLNCVGAIVEVDNVAEGFTVGELLNDDTAVIHIEKANGKIHGLYTFLNQQFCENQWSTVKYINREQDLGVEGLKKAKLSYHPAKMVDKYIVKFN